MHAVVDCNYIGILAEPEPYLVDLCRVEHRVSLLEFRGPAASLHFLVGVHYQDWNYNAVTMFPEIFLRLRHSVDPCCSNVGGIDHFPVGVIFPVAMELFQQRIGIAVAMSLLYLGILEYPAPESDGGDKQIAVEGREVPGEERGVAHHSSDLASRASFGCVIGCRESSGRVPEKGYVMNAVAVYLVYC